MRTERGLSAAAVHTLLITPTWDLIGHHGGRGRRVARHWLVVDHVTALRHGIVDHVERVGDVGHADQTQAHQVRLLHHHLVQDGLRTDGTEEELRQLLNVMPAVRPPVFALTTCVYACMCVCAHSVPRPDHMTDTNHPALCQVIGRLRHR